MRDKEWAQREVDRYLSHEGVNEARNALVFAKGVINQLDEPEKVVIPKFVADWLDDNIERYKTVYSFIISLVEVFGDTVPEKVWTYASENPDTMARAYLDGYTVKEEQKYYVLSKDKNTILLERWTSGPSPCAMPIIEKEEGDMFTEQEIKDYDERYMNFAVKVEELEG